MPRSKEKNNERAAKHQEMQEIRALDQIHADLSSKAKIHPQPRIPSLGVCWQAPNSSTQLPPQQLQHLPLEQLLYKVEQLAKLARQLQPMSVKNNPGLTHTVDSTRNALAATSRVLLEYLVLTSDVPVSLDGGATARTT